MGIQLEKLNANVSEQPVAKKIIADINQKPLDQKAELDAIRKSVSTADTTGETALQRLKRLSGKMETESV